MTEHDCTRDEFDAWCDQLSELLMAHEPRVCDSVGVNWQDRTMGIDLYGQQVRRLLEELTLLAQYKASTEAAKRRSQDPDFMDYARRVIEERDRELNKLRTFNREFRP